ncbi:MFS monocarboxylate transporter [Heterobasidion irregulare TC 32-1]|uniref:MFS monocarboxylate transporter n=1 Tax=Heterobasidion irregulare (strain TC 32-1) TaxID=747525 RepID=W4KC63_HETIT|nr:MFS monocarboxylate transporter [Heterobasidion irregulare TC 32-1]ETW83314.1 MFS monocarboxylate transporter [Heterobasidion irregulare TC 32-1]
MGRWRAWSTVLGAWLIVSCSIGMTSAFGVFQDFYTTTWLDNHSASAISWVGGVQIFLELILGPIGGKLFDMGYIRTANIAGCTLFTFSFFMLSLAQPHQYYQVFLAQGIGMGAGIGLLYIPASTVVFHHFKSKRAFATGLVDSGASVGGIFLSILLNHLIHGSVGFVWGTRIAAFITLFCFILGNLLIYVPPIKKTVDGTKTTFTDAPYILTVAWGFAASLGMYFPAFYVQLFARMHGISSGLAFYSLAIMNAASVFGRVVPSWLADRWGLLEVFVPCTTLGGLVGFAMLGSTTPAGLVLFVVFYGFFFGASVALYLPIIDSLTPAGANKGKRMGFAIVPVGVACLVGPPISGAILGSSYAWWKGVVFASVTDTVPCVFLAAALYILRRNAKAKARVQSPTGA